MRRENEKKKKGKERKTIIWCSIRKRELKVVKKKEKIVKKSRTRIYIYMNERVENKNYLWKRMKSENIGKRTKRRKSIKCWSARLYNESIVELKATD